MVSKLAPASWKLVMPLVRLSSIARSISLRRSAMISSGVLLFCHLSSAAPIRPCAVSRNTPIGLPAWSLRISPPGGFGVARVMPASSIAFALA